LRGLRQILDCGRAVLPALRSFAAWWVSFRASAAAVRQLKNPAARKLCAR